MPYSVAENVHTTATCPSLKENTSRPAVSISDHIHHLEAFILSFTAENLLPLSTVPKLIEFSQFLARNPKALSQLQINRTTATYKLKHGLSVYIRKNVVDCMKKYTFSINIDEYTSNNSYKVFSILVSYFDTELGASVVQHYTSVSLIEVNAKSLLECICNCFVRDGIPFDNLVSDLSNSTNYKRGKKGGLEPLLREKTPQLLDIDGDICHHIHNTVKQFECFVEKWIDDIHWDTKYSTDILD